MEEIFGQWIIDKFGNLECPEEDYFIDKERLQEGDWIRHLQAKIWVNMNDFIPAYLKALKRAGIKTLEMDV